MSSLLKCPESLGKAESVFAKLKSLGNVALGSFWRLNSEMTSEGLMNGDSSQKKGRIALIEAGKREEGYITQRLSSQGWAVITQVQSSLYPPPSTFSSKDNDNSLMIIRLLSAVWLCRLPEKTQWQRENLPCIVPLKGGRDVDNF